MMTDPIADMLTRLRNASRIERPVVEMPATRQKMRIAQVLKDEGFISDFHVGKYAKSEGKASEFVPGATLQEAKAVLRVFLKYGPEGEKVIRHIQRSSRPGRRYYQGAKEIRRVLDGLGIAVLSTSKGVLSDRQARKQGVGGEVLAIVW